MVPYYVTTCTSFNLSELKQFDYHDKVLLSGPLINLAMYIVQHNH